MIKNILNTFLFFVLLYLAILLVNSGIWLLVYVELFVIIGLVKLARGNIPWSIVFLVAGSALVDIFSSQIVGLTAFFIILSLLLLKLTTRIVAPLDNQSREVKVISTFLVFYIINSIYYFGQDILNFGQIFWVGSLNVLILVVLLIVSAFTKKSGNAFKV